MRDSAEAGKLLKVGEQEMKSEMNLCRSLSREGVMCDVTCGHESVSSSFFLIFFDFCAELTLKLGVPVRSTTRNADIESHWEDGDIGFPL